MGRRPVLALSRAQPFRPGVLLPLLRMPSLPSPRAPTRREFLILVGILVLLGAAYAGARESRAFAVQTVTISGGPAQVGREVRASLRYLLGTNLVALDPGDVERRITALPSVRAARVDRTFPHELTVVVEAERPLAVVRRGTQAWVVAESGTVIRDLEWEDSIRLPRIRVPATVSLGPGLLLTDLDARAAIAVLRAVPQRFPLALVSVRSTDGAATAVLNGGVALELGPPIDLRRKMAAAAAVLRAVPDDERRALAYLDVVLPQRPVAAPKAQLESES
jgi:cell division protein FtsQ